MGFGFRVRVRVRVRVNPRSTPLLQGKGKEKKVAELDAQAAQLNSKIARQPEP